MDSIDLKKLQGWPFVWIGVAATALYVLAIFVLRPAILTHLTSASLSVAEFGDAISGMFAPLALIWVIVGVLQQGRELQIQLRELKESVEAQKEMARASGGQERLQNEQFLERLYRLHKAACQDVLYQLFEPEHLTQMVLDGRGGKHRVGVLGPQPIELQRSKFREGDRGAILAIARDLSRQLRDRGTNLAHTEAVIMFCKDRMQELARDFLKFDDARRSALGRFEGGEALGRVDYHEGFDEARNLADAYSRLGPP